MGKKIALNVMPPRFKRSDDPEIRVMQDYLGELYQKLQTMIEDINNSDSEKE